eukprot:356939-Chlamydomonas_euryale.AAC.1
MEASTRFSTGWRPAGRKLLDELASNRKGNPRKMLPCAHKQDESSKHRHSAARGCAPMPGVRFWARRLRTPEMKECSPVCLQADFSVGTLRQVAVPSMHKKIQNEEMRLWQASPPEITWSGGRSHMVVLTPSGGRSHATDGRPPVRAFW